MRSINVLILDDDTMAQKLADLALSNRGMRIWTAYNTAEADSILHQRHIDVIVSDVVMFPENGVDYCQRLRDRGIKIPIILVSALVSPLVMQTGLAEGAAAFLTKPFEIEQLYQRVLEVLATFPVAIPLRVV